MLTDPVSDFLTRIRNAIMADQNTVLIPASKLKASVSQVLKDEGFIKNFSLVVENTKIPLLKLHLKPGAISGLKRESRPGLRKYASFDKIPRILSGLGIAIVSTSKGVLSSRVAIKERVGGEVLCSIW